jgi:hypothetical protein
MDTLSLGRRDAKGAGSLPDGVGLLAPTKRGRGRYPGLFMFLGFSYRTGGKRAVAQHSYPCRINGRSTYCCYLRRRARAGS